MAEQPEFADLLMRCYVQVIDELAELKGIKKGDFAQKIWPADTLKASRTRWLHIRTSYPNTGQPQGLLVSDAYRMAQALGENFLTVMVRAEDLARRMVDELKMAGAELKTISQK